MSFSEEPDGTQHSARFEVNNESILWVTGTPNISYVTFGGDLDALDFQEVADCLSQLNSEAAQHAVPGESTPVTRQINGGELIVVLTLPSDADGTPGAAPMGTQAATVMDLAKQKLALASDVLNQFLIKPLTDMSVAYLPMSDETLPVTPMADAAEDAANADCRHRRPDSPAIAHRRPRRRAGLASGHQR